MIIINFKNYKFGSKALKLAKKIQKYLPKAIICPPAIDIENLSQKTKLKIFAQSADPLESNRATGFNTLAALKKAGASGVLINHSEHPLSLANIHKILIISKKLNIKTIVCTSTLKGFKSILSTKQLKIPKPLAIAFEDPKLIGTGKSITKFKSKDVSKFALLLKRTKIIPLCGAGISTAEDIKQAKALGCEGVLISSAIANVKNPSRLLKQIAFLKTK